MIVLIGVSKAILRVTTLFVTLPLYVLWEVFCWFSDHWKTIAILALSFVNIVSFLAAANTRRILAFETSRLVAVDNAQRFAARALGLAEMESLRAADLQARLDILLEEIREEEGSETPLLLFK